MATALAVLVVEFLIDKILAGMGKIFKGILKAAKATKVGKFITKGASVVKKGSSATGKVIKKGISKIKGSKLVVSFNKRVGKGIKKFSTFRKKILDKFGFDKIWFEKQGRFIELWGSFNSKILLSKVDADGNRQTRDLTPADRIKMKQSGHGKKEIGQKLDDGVVVSDDFMQRFNKLDTEGQAGSLKKLDADDFKTRRGEGGKTIRPEPTNKAKYVDEQPEIFDSQISPKTKDGELVNKHAKKRKDNIDSGNTSKAIKESEKMGEAASDAYIRSKYKEVELLETGKGARTVDKVYLVGKPPNRKVIVVEAKGGKGTLGSKKSSIDEKIVNQQGTREYLKQTVKEMKNSGDPAKMKAASEMQKALDANNIEYLHIQQPVDTYGIPLPSEIKKFVIDNL